MVKKVNLIGTKLEKKMSYCDDIQEKRNLDSNLFLNLSMSKEELLDALKYFYYKSFIDCAANEENALYIAMEQLLKFFTDVNIIKNKEVIEKYSVFLPDSRHLLEFQLKYEKINNKRDKGYLNSLNELKKPFNSKIIEELRKKLHPGE